MTERQVQPFQRPLVSVSEQERPRAIGALLFVATEPVQMATLAQQLDCTISECREAVNQLQASLDAVGLVIQWTGEDELQLSSAPGLAPVLQRFLGLERTVRLSQAALETLAIVAYRQPVTRAEIESVRGVDSSGVLQTLLARSLIEPVGRLPAVGNPVLYGTTPEFLRFFGLQSLGDLPVLPDELAATMAEKLEARQGGPDEGGSAPD